MGLTSSKDGLYLVLKIIGEFIIIILLSAYVIPMAFAAFVPDLPTRTSTYFANNTVRILVNLLMAGYVLAVYKYRLGDNVWVWTKDLKPSMISPGLVVPAFFFIRLLLDGGLWNLKMVLYPYMSEALSGIITTPFAEELLYRGLLLRQLYPVVGQWPAIMISSVLFGLAHGNFIQALVPGLLLGAIYAPPQEHSLLNLGTGNLWVCVILHALLNIKTH